MGGYTVDSSGSDCKSDALGSGGATPSPPTNIRVSYKSCMRGLGP